MPVLYLTFKLLDMLKRTLNILIVAFFTILLLGLIAALFIIGLFVFWYVLVITAVAWLVRRIYYFIKGEKPPSVMQQYTTYTRYYYRGTPPGQREEKVINPNPDE